MGHEQKLAKTFDSYLGLGMLFSIGFFDFNTLKNNESSGFEAADDSDYLSDLLKKIKLHKISLPS